VGGKAIGFLWRLTDLERRWMGLIWLWFVLLACVGGHWVSDLWN
jgi:hypothetical protein